jgi:hypothetical protein
MRILFYFAVAGWLLGLTVHLLALAHINASDTVPFVMLLHVGIFIVWIPMVLKLRKNDELQKTKLDGGGPYYFFRFLRKTAPGWMVNISIICLVYAVINFALFFLSEHGTASILADGRYELHDRGNHVRFLTQDEYYQLRANELRGFSGHWLAFYSIAAVALFPFSGLGRKKPDTGNGDSNPSLN